jgi:WD40 repeat protein
LAFSHDGQRLAIAWHEWTSKFTNDTKRIGLSLWNFQGPSREFEMVPGDHWAADRPTQLRFSPDGETLWMASSGSLRSWDIRSGKLKRQWKNPGGGMAGGSSMPFYSALSADCRLNFRFDEDGYTVWDVATQKTCASYTLAFSPRAGT